MSIENRKLTLLFQREKQDVSANDILAALAGGEDIALNQCIVTGALDINRLLDPGEKFQMSALSITQASEQKTLTLTQSIVFDKCTFEENIVFSGPWDDKDSLSVEFKKDVIFNSSQFSGQARFRNAVFRGTAGFDGCVFGGVVTFNNAAIHGDAKFRTAVFNGYCLFGGAVFKDSARFTNTHFVKGANFSHVKFFSQTDFDGVYSSSRAVPTFDSIFFARKKYGYDESFWRFAKQSAQEAGHYRLAGDCFYNERCANLRKKSLGPDYDSLSLAGKIARAISAVRLLPELVFGKMLFGYGERPVRVVFAGALIIFVCAFFYAQPGAVHFRGPVIKESFLQGLYFSTITFTTLGYGDLYPAADAFHRGLSMIEAVAGSCMMALFVISLAKRFSRG